MPTRKTPAPGATLDHLPRLYTYAEAERVLRLSHTTIQRLAAAGRIKRVPISGTSRLDADSVDRYLLEAYGDGKPARRRPGPK